MKIFPLNYLSDSTLSAKIDEESLEALIALIILYPFPEKVTLPLEMMSDSSAVQRFLLFLEKMGADSIDLSHKGFVTLSGGNFLDGMQIDGVLFEEFLTILLIMGIFSNFDIRLYNLAKLEEETQTQLTSILKELSKMGVQYSETPDMIFLQGPQQITGTSFEVVNDLKVATALVIAALYARSASEIRVSSSIEEKFTVFIGFLSQLVSGDIFLQN